MGCALSNIGDGNVLDDGTERDRKGEIEREGRPCRDSYIILMRGSAALNRVEAGPYGNQRITKYNLKDTST